ncbi:MAG TPA: carbohydrate ABC transporter permease, partial [Clostridia bacterium]|nr:carbohydrate ABC transporter permease [Clostridia bacterium]
QESLVTSSDSTAEPIAETIKYATIMVGTIPVLMIYPFLQRYFVKGVMVGAIKG